MPSLSSVGAVGFLAPAPSGAKLATRTAGWVMVLVLTPVGAGAARPGEALPVGQAL